MHKFTSKYPYLRSILHGDIFKATKRPYAFSLQTCKYAPFATYSWKNEVTSSKKSGPWVKYSLLKVSKSPKEFVTENEASPVETQKHRIANALSPGPKKLEEVMKFYESNLQLLLKSKDEISSLKNLKPYFVSLIQILERWKSLPNESRQSFHKEFEKILDADSKRISPHITILTNNLDKENTKELVQKTFEIFNICLPLRFKIPVFFKNVLSPLMIPSILFADPNARYFFIAISTMKRYANNYLDSALYAGLLNYLVKNFHNTMNKVPNQAFLSHLNTLTFEQINNNELCSLIAQKIIKDLSDNKFTPAEILQIFTFLSRSEMFSNNESCLRELESDLIKLDLSKIGILEFRDPLRCLKNIKKYSTRVHEKILETLTNNHAILLNETNFHTLLKSFENADLPDEFLDTLNKLLDKYYTQYTVQGIAGLIFQLKRKNKLEKALFNKIEEYLCEKVDNHVWTIQELHHVFFTCIHYSYNDSPLFTKLEPHVLRILKSGVYMSDEEFSVLLWEIFSASYIPKFEIFKLMLKKTRATFQCLVQRGADKTISETLKALGGILCKYAIFDEENYITTYHNEMRKELELLIPEINEWLGKVSFYDYGLPIKVRTFQFLFTVYLEFPDIVAEAKEVLNVIDYFKKGEFSYNVTTSSLSFDVINELRKRNYEFKVEHRVYAYLLDAFMEPNLAIEIQGTPHYIRDKEIQKYQDIFKDYHLTKLGYKIIYIPSREFRNIDPNDEKKMDEYFKEKIYGNKETKTHPVLN